MDVVAGAVVSSAESAAITIYQSFLTLFGLGPYAKHEGFRASSPEQAIRIANEPGYSLKEQPGETMKYVAGQGEGGDDTYSQYRPYIHKTEFSSRIQKDNHRWPISSEMDGPFEQTLRKNMILPCNYPSPGSLLGKSRHAPFGNL